MSAAFVNWNRLKATARTVNDESKSFVRSIAIFIGVPLVIGVVASLWPKSPEKLDSLDGVKTWAETAPAVIRSETSLEATELDEDDRTIIYDNRGPHEER